MICLTGFTIQIIIMASKRKQNKRKSKRRVKNKKIIPLNLKSLGSDISKYPFVVIEWLDIEGDAGWSDTRALNKLSLETIGNTTIIPTSVIQSIKKLS